MNLLMVQVNILTDNLNQDDELLQKMFGGRTEQEAVDYLLSKSRLTSKEEVIALANEGADAILNSDDPFIYFIMHTKDELEKMQEQNNALREKDEVNNQLLGEALIRSLW